MTNKRPNMTKARLMAAMVMMLAARHEAAAGPVVRLTLQARPSAAKVMR